MTLDPVDLLRQLIQIPSINPMGHVSRDPHVGEARLTDFLQAQCEKLGLPWVQQRVHPDRDNLVTLIRGNPPVEQGGEFLLWDVHQDTVPIDGMTVDPFGGQLHAGRVHGRGACDVKGSMAAMLAAISRAANSAGQLPKSPTVAIAFTVDEECGFTGVKALCDLFPSNRQSTFEIVGGTISPTEMFPQLPDAAIVAEPTEFNVVVAHQGVARWRCHTIGRAAHTSRPDGGINAIYGMTQIIQAIERHHADLQQNGPLHPLCGRPSACVSTIRGGVAVNTVPERATIEIDRRTGPDEQPKTAYDGLVRFVTANADAGSCRVEHDPPYMQSRGLSDQRNQPLAKVLASLVHQHSRPGELVGVPYATDAAAIAATDIPTVVFGPGSIAQAHTADEFIAIDELQTATEIFYRIATEGLNREPSG
jgi:acetylornithine deacetylase/succinyl-diaminopimelate desuccinylase-like protein